MIKLKDSQIAQILPEYLSERPEVKALSYAISQAVRRHLGYADSTAVYAEIDSMPDAVLDLLAIEMGTQYYGTDLPVEYKRKLIKNTLIWYANAGTKNAVSELANSIYGGISELEEWFEYNGDPGTFRIHVDISDSVDNPTSDYDVQDLRNRMAQSKRLSAHLESISYMIRHAIQIKKKTESWAYQTPECGTIYCGTYWMSSTLGYTEDPGIAIGVKPDGFIYTPDFAGTKPIVSVKGYSVDGTEEVSGRADAYSISPTESGMAAAGTMPDISTKGYSVAQGEAVSGQADAYVSEPGESGTINSGTVPVTATKGLSGSDTVSLEAAVQTYTVTPAQSGVKFCGA